MRDTHGITVDLTLRLEAPAEGRLSAVKVRDGDFLDRKVRLTSAGDVDRGKDEGHRCAPPRGAGEAD